MWREPVSKGAGVPSDPEEQRVAGAMRQGKLPENGYFPQTPPEGKVSLSPVVTILWMQIPAWPLPSFAPRNVSVTLFPCHSLGVERQGKEPVSPGPEDGMGHCVIPSVWSRACHKSQSLPGFPVLTWG